jgi:hypothetical protein
MNFSFPEINFSEVFNDSIFNRIYSYNFNFDLDSISGSFNNIDFEKLKENQKYLQEWQEANKDNLLKLRNKAGELAKRNKLFYESRIKASAKRAEAAKKRAEASLKRAEAAKKRAMASMERAKAAEKRSKARFKAQKKRHEKIKDILKNRNEAKVRTKLIIRVPKGTTFDMNVNYSKISTN